MHDDYLPAGNAARRYASLRRCGAAASAALVLAWLVACPGSVSASKVAPSSSAATPPAKAERARTDAAVPTVALPISVENAPADFRRALEAIQASLSLPSRKDWHILVNNPERKDRLAWLAKDFGVQVFRLAERVDEAHLQAQTSAGLLHIGLLVIDFPKCKQLTAANRANGDDAERSIAQAR